MKLIPIVLAFLGVVALTYHTSAQKKSGKTIDYINHTELSIKPQHLRTKYPLGLTAPGPDIEHGALIGFSVNSAQVSECRSSGGNLSIYPTLARPSHPMEQELPHPKLNLSLVPEKSDLKIVDIKPGYAKYQVLPLNISVEVTSSTYLAYYKFIFPKNIDKPALDINFGSGYEATIQANAAFEGKNIITGSYKSGNTCAEGAYKQYFHLNTSAEFDTLAIGKNKYQLLFAPTPNAETVVEVIIALSAVAPDKPLKNKRADLTGASFAKLVTDQQTEWNKRFAQIKINGFNKKQAERFYTALFNLYQKPSVVSDIDYWYNDYNGIPHKNDGFHLYSGYNIDYDARYRLPTFMLIDPDVAEGVGRSLSSWFAQNPKSELGYNQPTPNTSFTNQAVVLYELYNKGFLGFDAQMAYFGAVDAATPAQYNPSPEQTLAHWTGYQFCDRFSNTLEMMKIKKRLDSDKEYFKINYQKSKIGFATLARFNHDVKFIEDVIGGKEQGLSELDYVMNEIANNPFDLKNLSLTYLYCDWGKESFFDEFIYRLHSSLPLQEKLDSLIAHDADGNLSAWYIQSALGLFANRLGSNSYLIAAPAVNQAQITFPNTQKVLTIKKVNSSDKNWYVKQVKFNGKPISGREITYQQLIQGGLIEVVMANEPNK